MGVSTGDDVFGPGPTWLTAFLDLAPAQGPAEVDYWRELTGYSLSPSRGERGEFATLLPPDGTDYLRVQRLADGATRVHLDLHVPDLAGARAAATAQGATVVAEEDGLVVCRSPAGFPFCLVGPLAGAVPAATLWRTGHRSRLARVCIDVPAPAFEDEVRFWVALTGWPVARPATVDWVDHLKVPATLPLGMILQRLGEDDGASSARAHLEWFTDDLAAETQRHLAAGAGRVGGDRYWTVLRDPAGLPYCLVSRDPVTGGLLDPGPPGAPR